MEHIKGSQFSTLLAKKFTIKTINVEADYYFITYQDDIIKVLNIVKDDNNTIFLICKQFLHKNII